MILTNSEENSKEYSNRYKLLHFIIGLSSLIIFSRLWYLQIISGKELRAYSEKNRIKENKLPAPRGLILDREGRVLVENLPGFAVNISPQYATHLKETAQAVGDIIEFEPKKIIKSVKVSRRRNGPFFPVTIKTNLTPEEVYKLKLIRYEHPGLDVNETILRHYPLKNNGAQLFGYVGEISKQQIKRYNKKYFGRFKFTQGDIIGKDGMEEVWEEELRGQSGVQSVEVDARGRQAPATTPSFLGLQTQPEIPGHNLILTIDKDIQEKALKAMNLEDRVGPRVGGLIAMKSNGEIVAWVNRPSFDPNEFSTGISNEIWSKLINDPNKPLRNKAIQDHYSPGSTFKPIIALAALQEKIITPASIIHAPGALRYGRRTYHDHLRGGHGHINVSQAIERSSNVFFYKMGIALGIDKMYKYASAFGIGRKTGIHFSGEVSGLMPNSEWKKKTFGETWQPGENLSNAIGQGYVLTTPLQMAVAFNTIGLEGKKYKPFLVKKIIDYNDQIIKEFQPELEYDLSEESNTQENKGEDSKGHGLIEKKYFKIVKEGMRRVANSDRGTARWWKIPGVEMAGKTGTSQVISFSADQIYNKCAERPLKQRHHAWYVAFAPADKPVISVAVLAEHACSGSSGGAPVVRDVVRAYIEKYHPEWIKKKPPRRISVAPKKTDQKPDPIPIDNTPEITEDNE